MKSNGPETMRHVQSRLLSEVSTYASDLDIPCFLMNRSAFGVRRDQPHQLERPVTVIGVRAKDFYKLLKHMQASIDSTARSLVHWGTKSSHPSYDALYVSDNTTYLQLEGGGCGEPRGLYVQIQPIRDEPAQHKRLNGRLCTAYELLKRAPSRAGGVSPGRGRLDAYTGLALRFRKPLSWAFANGWSALWFFGRAYDNPEANRCFYRKPDGAVRWLDSEGIFPPRFIERWGTVFPIPAGDEYFVSVYGKKWETRKLSKWVARKGVLISPIVPHKRLVEVADAAGYPVEEIPDLKARLRVSKAAATERLQVMRQHWNMPRVSRDRFDLFETYQPLKEGILEAYAAGRHVDVARAIAPYTALVEAHMRHGIGLYFDEELLKVQIDLFKKAGREEFANEFEGAVPEHHRKSFVGFRE